MKISAILIVRNEERFLGQCLRSLEGHVDEIVVVDTGSTDDTVQIAKLYGAVVEHFPWVDDFAAARNVSLQKATGDWCLQIDADEVLVNGNQLRPTVEKLEKIGKVGCGVMLLSNALDTETPAEEVLNGKSMGPPMRVPRLIHKLPGIQFEGAIHETISQTVMKNLYKFCDIDTPQFVHYGSVQAIVDERAKTDRNLNLLKKRVERAPEDIVALGYLAMEMFGDALKNGGRYTLEEVYDFASKAWDLVLKKRPTFDTIHRLVVTKAAIERSNGQWEKVLQTVLDGEQIEGPKPDYDCLAALAYESLGRSKPIGSPEMIEAFLNAEQRFLLAVDPQPIGDSYVIGATSFESLFGLGRVLSMFSNWEAAENALREALRHLPESAEIQQALDLVREARAEEAK